MKKDCNIPALKLKHFDIQIHPILISFMSLTHLFYMQQLGSHTELITKAIKVNYLTTNHLTHPQPTHINQPSIPLQPFSYKIPLKETTPSPLQPLLLVMSCGIIL